MKNVLAVSHGLVNLATMRSKHWHTLALYCTAYCPLCVLRPYLRLKRLLRRWRAARAERSALQMPIIPFNPNR